MLPSDYAGPPAATVAVNVLGNERYASNPAFSLEWLMNVSGVSPAAQTTGRLLGQPLQFQRSEREHDWNIGVELPAIRARLDLAFASDHVRFGVAKMVYFDDGQGDRRLDWDCQGAGCDVVKAVSAEFIVFVEQPPTCMPTGGGPIRPRIAPGFHYYRFESGSLREISPGEPLTFVPTVQPLADSNPTRALEEFATFLIERWQGAAFDRC
jgi:hypothetical protein